MCKERWRTRDLLLEYDRNIMPPRPRAAGLGTVYPWENMSLSFFAHQLYTLAARSGYDENENVFNSQFGSYLKGKQIIYDLFINFPETGETDKLYFDLDEKILYYWDEEYKPVNAMLIENTILNGGNADNL